MYLLCFEPPSTPTPLGYHRAPTWVPWVIQKLPASYLLYTIVYIRRRQWHPTPALLPRESHGRRSPVGCSPWGRKESDTTERLSSSSSSVYMSMLPFSRNHLLIATFPRALAAPSWIFSSSEKPDPWVLITWGLTRCCQSRPSKCPPLHPRSSSSPCSIPFWLPATENCFISFHV